MNIPNKFLHPLQHDGVSRKQRQLAALLPAFVSVNERGVEDLLLYARKYAQMLQFFDESGKTDGDWLPFLEGDATVVASIILKEENAQDYQHRFHAQLDIFESDAETDIRSAALNQVLLLLLEMAERILYWQTSTVPGLSFSNHLTKLIPSVAGDGFCRLIAYLRRAMILGILTDDLPLDQYEAEWPYLEPPRSFAPLKEGMPETEQALFREVVLLRQLFNKFFEVIAPVLISAPVYLQETLDQHPEHEPHMALFLSFLLLMEEVKEDMNTLTKRHLDFYYREVLQLDNAAAVMDQAHLVLELAQGFVNGLLETTDRFLDGKDSAGKDILFSPNEELVVTPATFDEENGLKTLFFDKNRTSSEDEAPAFEILNAYGAPDADSDDRKSADGKWIPLGSIDDPAARFGFAIASPMFLLGEGEREINLTFQLEGFAEVLRIYGLSSVRNELERNIEVFYSAEKEWAAVDSVAVTIDSDQEELIYSLTISADSAPFIGYHKGLIGLDPVPEDLLSSNPVLLFTLNNFGLSVEGDFDLSMEGDLASKVFAANTFYLSGELTFGDNSYQHIYEAKANPIGISPDSNKDIWQNVTALLTAPTPITFSSLTGLAQSISKGSYVSYNGRTYRANADLVPGFEIEPDAPSEERLLWGKLEDSQGLFDPEAGYGGGAIVEDKGTLYKTDIAIPPISPNHANSYWKPIPDGNSETEFTSSNSTYYQFGGSFFEILVSKTNLPPITNGGQQELIWKNISAQILTYQPGGVQTYTEEVLVFDSVSGDLFQLTNDQNNSIERSTDSPPGTAVSAIWKPVPAYSSAPAIPFSPEDVPFALEAGQVHECSLPIIPSSGTGPSNELYRKPGQLVNGIAIRVWMTISEYDTGADYDEGSYVQVTGTPIEFYLAQTDILAGDDPGNNPNGNWTHLGNSATSGFAPGWNSGVVYQFNQIVQGASGSFFVATVQNESRDPQNQNQNNNSRLWEQVTLDPFNSQTLYQQLDGIDFNGTAYYAGYKSKNILPTLVSTWENLGSLPLYDANKTYLQGDQIRDTNSLYYQCLAEVSNISPADGTTVWKESTSIIEAYSAYLAYFAGNIVTWKNAHYYADKAVDKFAPAYDSTQSGVANVNIWDKTSEVAEFEVGVLYGENEVVKFFEESLTYYQTVAPVADVHPGLQLLVWEEVPEEISAFTKNTLYEAGEYVSMTTLDPPQMYRACVAIQAQELHPTEKVWVENTTVIHQYPFSGQVPDPGSYVEHQNELFRLLSLSPTSVPGTNSVDWQRVGEIRFHNPDIAWFPNLHARDIDGNIYRAKEYVTGNVDITDLDYWEPVSGSYPYRYLQQPFLNQLTIQVDVTNMRNLILENDQGIVNSAKPFLPFGSQPNVGSNFYIGSHEIFSKTVTHLKLAVEWGNLPASFVTHYENYLDSAANSQPVLALPSFNFLSTFSLGSTSPVAGNDYFQGAASLLFDHNKRGFPIGDPFSLFVKPGESSLASELVFEFDIANFNRDPELDPFDSASPLPKRGFLILKSNQHFFHSEYPTVLSKAAIDQDTSTVPNPPYTPLINSLTLDYTAKETIVFQDKAKGDLQDLPEQFFHLHPYGWTEFVPVEESLDDGQGPIATNHLVPRYEAQVGDENGQAGFTLQNGVPTPEFRDAAGNLFLGIKDLQAPQILNILVQVAEGSENPAVDKRFISWSYLRDNRWVQFEPSQILSDDSNGFLRPGIVKLSVPSDITNQNTMLPGDIFWIRAAVAEDPNGVGQIYDVRLHAVKATFEDNENDLSRLSTGLEATSLSRLFFRKAVIKKVEQPFASFGGNLEEQDSDFYQRVSERLRHKQRAITIFDYERLVLAQFPTVYQVKCITHSMGINDLIPTSSVDDFLHERLESGIEHRPGMVQVIVLPDLRNQNAIDPLRPRVSNNLRDEIQTFLDGFCSGFSQVKVENPVFEEVAVLATVTLLPGKDPGFYLNKLNEDLITYLSPWRFDTDYDLHFGGELHISPLIDFMDELDYIDYVDHVALQVSLRDSDGISHPLEAAQEAVCTHTSASVLVSAPAHSITLNESVTPC